MRVLYAAVCEDATMRGDGRMDLHGIFHQLYAPGFPAKQERVTLVVVIEWESEERGRIAFGIDLLDPSGAPALSVSGHSDVDDAAGGEGPPQTRLVLPMEGVVFPMAGSYEFELRVGELRSALTPLHLIHNADAR
jgi:hypothetical protein